MNLKLKERVERLLQTSIRSVRVPSGGYTQAHRLICDTEAGPVFVKVGVDAFTNEGIQREIALYEALNLACMPRVIATEKTPEAPILVLEDLSHCRWPPPWHGEDLHRVLETIHGMHQTSLSKEMRVCVFKPPQIFGGWQNIARAPEAFLATGLVLPDRLATALPTLIEAEKACSYASEALVHYDLRSDNLCIGDERVTLIDWSWAQLGNPRLDLGFFINTVCMETGDDPEPFLKDAPEEAATICGFFADQCGRAPIPGAPHVRSFQRAQCVAALGWVRRVFNVSL